MKNFKKRTLGKNLDFLDKKHEVQILIWPEGDQQRIAVIFCGAVKSTREDEKVSWNPEVDIYW